MYRSYFVLMSDRWFFSLSFRGYIGLRLWCYVSSALEMFRWNVSVYRCVVVRSWGVLVSFPRKRARQFTLGAKLRCMRFWVLIASSTVANQQVVASLDINNREDKGLSKRYLKCWGTLKGSDCTSLYKLDTLVLWPCNHLSSWALTVAPWTTWFLPFHIVCVYSQIADTNRDDHTAGFGCLDGVYILSYSFLHSPLIRPKKNWCQPMVVCAWEANNVVRSASALMEEPWSGILPNIVDMISIGVCTFSRVWRNSSLAFCLVFQTTSDEQVNTCWNVSTSFWQQGHMFDVYNTYCLDNSFD